ncbi:MAG: hypothetical protein ACRD2W_12920 [Acidimicrobiales bacterium]
MGRADLSDREAYERELRRLAAGDPRRYTYFRREVSRSVRRGEAVTDPAAAPLAIGVARRVQVTRTFPWYVVLPTLVLAVLSVFIGGFALVWFLATVLPTVLTEPFRARRRRSRALSSEAANLALL